MKKRIPRILFAAPASGNGKTMVTCGFLKLCQRRGIGLRAMKCGPDYIDSMFHHDVLGIDGVNLDSFFLGKAQLTDHFAEAAKCCELAVIEGVMGYYDGLAGTSTQASTYDIARITRTPVILVVDAKKSSLSLAALIKGFLEFRKDSGIVGVILNRVTEGVAERLRPEIEALGLYMAGWIPDCESASLRSRHLGLTMPGQQTALKENMEKLADEMEIGLDVEWLLKAAKEAPLLEYGAGSHLLQESSVLQMKHKRHLRLAVAKDEAFAFYYRENLKLLEAVGAELIFFSPLKDTKLPDNVEAVLLGGGYPELYARQLSENKKLLADLLQKHQSGMKILAECGGFLYLHQTLEGEDKKVYPMAGIIKGHGFRTERLSRFGYITLEGNDGGIRGHEFHYWESDNCGNSNVAVKPLTNRSWSCMHRTEKLFAGFPHLYYLSNPEPMIRFLFEEGTGL